MTTRLASASKLSLLSIASYSLIVCILAAIAFAAILNGRFWTLTLSPYTLLSIIISLSLSMSLFWFGGRSKGFDPLEIVYPVTLFYLVNYPIRSLFIILFPNFAILPPYWPGEVQMTYALNLSVAGITMFYVGYFMNTKGVPFNIFPKFFFQWTNNSINLKILSLYGIGLAAWVVLFLSGRGLRFQWVNDIGAFDYVWILLGNFRIWAIFLIWSKSLSDRRTPTILAYTLLFIEIILNLGVGSKQAIFDTLMAVLFTYQYVLKQTPWRLLVLVGLIFIFLFTPLTQIYRDTYANTLGYKPSPSLNDIVTVIQEYPREILQNADEWMVYAITYTGNRAAYLDTVTLLTSVVPSTIPYQSGYTLMLGIWGLIPRFLWPDKPVINMGSYVTAVIFGSSSTSNTPLTDIGEFYLNYGLTGVLIGMFALGALFRSVYLYCKSLIEHDSILGALMYLSLFSSLVFLQTGVGSITTVLTRVIPLTIVTEWFLTGMKKRQPGGTYG